MNVNTDLIVTDRSSGHGAKHPNCGVVAVVMLLSSLFIAGTAQAQTYYIDEGTSYSSAVSPCQTGLPDLNTVTSSLRTALDGQGWSGSRYVNAGAWSTDFTESCSSSYGASGADSTWADNASLLGMAVFAGHANSGYLAFNGANAGACNLDFASNMRLGSMAGAKAAVGMWLGCDVLAVSTLAAEANWEWLHQQLGYTNTIGIGDDEPRDFYNATFSSNNVNAWINEFNNQGRKPIVVSYGSSSDACWTYHTEAQLAGGLTSSRGGGPSCGDGQPLFYYCYTNVN